MDALSRYRGCMLGLAIGDALGSPVEGLKDGHIRRLYGEVGGYVDPAVAWKQRPGRWRVPGLYSDDTQQALILADVLVRRRGFDAGRFTDLLMDMARAETGGRFGAHRGTGGNFRKTVSALMSGARPDQAGEPSAGIGAMMRAAPCGLYFAGGEEAVMRAAVEQGVITHRDPRSLVMAALAAVSVSLSARGAWDGVKPGRRLDEVAEFAAAAERMVERDFVHLIPPACMDRFGLALSGVRLLPRLLDLPEERMAFAQIVGEANRQFPEHKITQPGQGFVMAAGLSALFVALKYNDFEDGVKTLVHLGKDTDTMAAIAGAVLGARLGEDGIPAEWKKGLVNGPQVALRGEALLAKSFAGLAIKDVVAMETELTIREERERAEFIARLEKRGELAPARKKQPPPVEVEVSPAEHRDRRGKRHKPQRVKAPWKK